jgi:YihY family inner membrane protein
MSPVAKDEGAPDRLRALAAEVARRVGGIAAVRTLLATLATYDRAGGGLIAAGLAYTSLLALLPGLLLLVSVIGFWVDGPDQRDRIVALIGEAVPPLEDISRIAFEQVASGAVPSGIIAIVGLLWGSSRFYAAIDNAFTRVFHGGRRRNEIERTLRGVLVTALVVALPLLALLVGSVAAWLLDLAPGAGDVEGSARALWQLATPLGSSLLFVVGTILVYRFVPGEPPSMQALLVPAILVGLVLAGFAQLFTWIGPRLAGVAAIYGTFVALFALLAWLAISFNLLLLGASWTRVRALAASGRPAVATPIGGSPGEDAAS